MADINANQLKTLESLRGRLLVLKGSMNSLGGNLLNPQQPLPSWPALQHQMQLILQNIEQIVVQSKETEQVLTSTVAFPTPDFPPTADNILTTLLRTKPEPSIEEWTTDGEKYADKVNQAGVLPQQDIDHLWASVAQIYSENGSLFPWGADYTREEMENGTQHVVTGLRRDLVEPILDPDQEFDDDDDEAELEDDEQGQDVKMDVDKPTVPASKPSQPPMPVVPVLKFLSTGGAG